MAQSVGQKSLDCGSMETRGHSDVKIYRSTGILQCVTYNSRCVAITVIIIIIINFKLSMMK
jgi:hypothetical protein